MIKDNHLEIVRNFTIDCQTDLKLKDTSELMPYIDTVTKAFSSLLMDWVSNQGKHQLNNLQGKQ